MPTVDMKKLRNVVIAGHSDSGKTTLAEHLLFTAGAITRLGKVTDGTATLDFEPEEHKRKESLALAAATFETDGHRVTLVDTPGYPDFVGEVIQGFQATDSAILVMDAAGGVEAGLEHAVALLESSETLGGRSITYRTAEIYHVRNGQVAERWAFSDDTKAITDFFA